MARVEEREELMKMIYQMSVQDNFAEEEYQRYVEFAASCKVSGYFREVYDQLTAHKNEIDKKIEQYSVKWKLSRMPKVDLAILRLAITEMNYIDNVPVSVAINEAVVLAKKFSTEKSSAFINGILGKVAREDE